MLIAMSIVACRWQGRPWAADLVEVLLEVMPAHSLAPRLVRLPHDVLHEVVVCTRKLVSLLPQCAGLSRQLLRTWPIAAPCHGMDQAAAAGAAAALWRLTGSLPCRHIQLMLVTCKASLSSLGRRQLHLTSLGIAGVIGEAVNIRSGM